MSNNDQPPIVLPPNSRSLPFPPSQPPMDYGYEVEQNTSLREYFHILSKRKWWVIGTFLLIFLGVAVFTLLRKPIYRSSVALQITQDNPGSQVSVDDKSFKSAGNDTLEKFQQTQYKILDSWSLAHRVVRALNLKDSPNFKTVRRKNPGKTDAEIEDAIAASVQKNLEVIPVRNSYAVEVAFQSSNKELSQRVVNAIADEYMYLSIDRRNESFALVKKWLDKQLGAMASKVQTAQKELYKFGQKNDIYTLADKDNVIVQKYIDLSSLLTKAQADKMAKEAQYQQIKGEGSAAPLTVNNPLVAALRQQEVTEQAKVSGMRKVFRDGHPDLQAEEANLAAVKGRLHAEVRRIEKSVKADYEAASRTEKLLNDSLTAQKDQMAKLQDNLSEYQILKRDAETNEQLYQALLARVKEANIAATMVPTNVSVIDPGRLPDKPFKPRTLRDLALAAVLGLSLGVGLAIVLEHLDDSIKSLNDLELAFNLPSLGVLPLLGGNGRFILSHLNRRSRAESPNMDLIVYKHPKSQASEAISHVYSSITLSTSGRLPCAIMISSPNPGEGKTMLAANLAQSYALNQRPVVLIDSDQRNPRLHKIFQEELQPGLSSYLTGSATLEEVLLPTTIPNLTIITAGRPLPNPGIYLNSETFKELLRQLRQQFSHIIIDTPPILGFADARFVSALVDAVLLMAKYHYTHKSAGHLTQQLLSQAPVLGVVLNSAGVHVQAYGGYYYYKHYKYYSKYYEGK